MIYAYAFVHENGTLKVRSRDSRLKFKAAAPVEASTDLAKDVAGVLRTATGVNAKVVLRVIEGGLKPLAPTLIPPAPPGPRSA